MKIFVSSTYLDLKEYRAEAKKAIEESGNEFVGMETFQSHTHEPSEFCPERVEECDAFVLLEALIQKVLEVTEIKKWREEDK